LIGLTRVFRRNIIWVLERMLPGAWGPHGFSLGFGEGFSFGFLEGNSHGSLEVISLGTGKGFS
jgi:hypothetical protein